MLYLSAITLQLLTVAARERLWAALATARARGARVMFDSNYRAAGWESAELARDAVRRTWELTSIAVPTFSDEHALFADPTPAATVARLREWGVAEIAVKDGGNGCVVWDGAPPVLVPAVAVESTVDTTAAGDAFNAGYLAARLDGADPRTAAAAGHAIAAKVITHPGAIVTDESLPPRGA
ncbi:PfkB family carbohydrate kinase [Amycolatopsis acidiphila]|uniref:PfkB family carbohydrate kinase n=1 Tax=Amycolatopsis acidiphila TaxID=715473 RepID=UPI0019A8FD43|nr:hypothetical protein GCM10017788_05550 [Amycolatopsis acidiphila]